MRCKSSHLSWWAVPAAAVLLGLAACYDTSPGTLTLAERGHYKGRTDPLVEKLKPGGKLERALQARLKLADGRP